MCGIAGFYETRKTRGAAERHAAGQAMADALAHRGPDGSGVWQDPDAPIVLAHRRLAIIDLTRDGRQPMESHSGRYVISFNGEIYNFAALAKQLAGAGAVFRGRSDTEVMLASFDHDGVNAALQKFGGMFAFALWDRRERVLHLVRDRMGKKPLYAGWAGGDLLFASELKAFHAHPGFKGAIDRRALTLYMRHGCVPAPFSIYEGVWQIPAGCRLTLGAGELEAGADLSRLMEQYWSHARAAEEARINMRDISDERGVEEFTTLLRACVSERMVSDVPLGAFLSGGIDSSAVAAAMQQVSPRPVKTFTIGFREAGFDEAGHAAKVAQHLGTDHHELYVRPREAIDVIAKLPDIYDEPFADISQIPTYMVSRFARAHVTVALSGDGGDEMLGGYARHYALPALWSRTAKLPPALKGLMRRAITALPSGLWSRLVPQSPQFGEKLYKVAELINLESPARAYAHLASLWPDPARIVRGAQEPPVPLTDPAWHPADFEAKFGFAERMMFDDALSYLPNDILTKVDRASMAASLEARAPLLDRRMFEFCWSLPLRFKVRGGQGKWLLRRALAQYVPENLFMRPKQGFAVPVAEWLRGPLRPWAEELLDEARLESDGYLDAKAVHAAWQAHLGGQGREAHKLWAVLMFQSWKSRWA